MKSLIGILSAAGLALGLALAASAGPQPQQPRRSAGDAGSDRRRPRNCWR